MDQLKRAAAHYDNLSPEDFQSPEDAERDYIIENESLEIAEGAIQRILDYGYLFDAIHVMVCGGGMAQDSKDTINALAKDIEKAINHEIDEYRRSYSSYD